MISFVIRIYKTWNRLRKHKKRNAKVEFPKWVYHKSKDPVIVLTKEGLNALGKGWKETPFKADKKQDAQTEEPATS